MKAVSVIPLAEWTPDRFMSWGQGLLGSLFAGSLLLLLALIWAYDYLIFFAIALAGALFLALVARDDLYLLCAILLGFAPVAGYEAGFQIEEALYGILYLSYLGYWFISRFAFYRDRVLQTKADAALFLFLVYVTASFGLTILFRGSLSAMISGWLSLTMLAFYFPVKEVLARDSRAPRALLFTLGALALFIGLRNLGEYIVEVTYATAWWQVTMGRVVENEMLLMMAAIGAFALMLYARSWISRTSLFGLFLLYSIGVIISLSRAVWLSLALGLFVIFLFVDRRRKLQLTLLVVGSTLITFGIGIVLFQETLTLILLTLFDRLLSLETAVSTDISLINRFIEMEAAWEQIKLNPIVGYGFGVEYRYYSLVFEHSRESSFVHNGYVGLLYRHGLVGAFLLLFFYGASTWRGIQVYLNRAAPSIIRVIGLIAVACLVAVALVTNSNNPFSVSDKTLFIAVAAALAAGGYERSRLRMDHSEIRRARN